MNADQDNLKNQLFDQEEPQIDTLIHQSQTSPPTVLSTDRVRQGDSGHNVPWVLAWGLASAVISLAVIGVAIGQGWLGTL
jgi:hypothetical protein